MENKENNEIPAHIRTIDAVEEISRLLREEVDKNILESDTRNRIILHIEYLLNMQDPEIRSLYMSWDKGDCSEVGLCEILLYQLIKKHKEDNGANYDTDYDQIKLRYGKHE